MIRDLPRLWWLDELRRCWESLPLSVHKDHRAVPERWKLRWKFLESRNPQRSAASKALSHANSLTCCQSSAILLNRDLKGRLGAVRQPKPSNVNRNKIQSRPFLAKLLFEMLRCVSYERHTGRKRRQAAHQERSCASEGCCDSAPHVPQGLDVAHSNELHTPAA